MLRIIWLTLILLGIVVVYASLQIFMETKPPSAVEVIIPGGASASEIAERLYQGKVIRSPNLFRLLARLSGVSARMQSGHYRFEEPADMWTVMKRIHEGDVILYQLTIPEGLRLAEIISLLAEKTETHPDLWRETLAELVNGADAEGMLLPETYSYEKPVQPKRILTQMLESQRRLLDRLGNSWLDRHQLRIVASIIEKETSIDRERPLIASVIRNRLRRNMPLQMDPTVIYGLWRTDGAFSGNLTKKDLERDTPWNTYTRTGLPLTPICNPGAASLKAAARPAETDYLYFVANGKGGHMFASTLAEHTKNVRQWMKMERKARSVVHVKTEGSE